MQRTASAHDCIPLRLNRTQSLASDPTGTLIPCYANTIGPAIIFSSDYIIGGADGTLCRGMQWQGTSLWMTLRYGPTTSITSRLYSDNERKAFFHAGTRGALFAQIPIRLVYADILGPWSNWIFPDIILPRKSA